MVWVLDGSCVSVRTLAHRNDDLDCLTEIVTQTDLEQKNTVPFYRTVFVFLPKRFCFSTVGTVKSQKLFGRILSARGLVLNVHALEMHTTPKKASYRAITIPSR